METKIGIRFAVAIALLLTTRGLPVQCQHQDNDDDDDDDNDGYGGLPMLAIPPEAIPYLSANGGNGVNEIVHTVKVIRHGGIEGHDEGTANVDKDATVRISGGGGVLSDGNGRITRKTTVVTDEKRPNRRVSSSGAFESTTHTEGSSRTAAASVSSADSFRSGSPVAVDNNGATMTTITTTTAADGFTPPSGDVGLVRKKTKVIKRRRGSDGGSVTFSGGKTDMTAAANDDGYDESLGSMSGGMVETSRISKGRPSRRVKTTIIEHDDGNDEYDEYAIRPNVITGDDGRSRAGSSYASGVLQQQWEQQQWEQQQWEQQQWEQQQRRKQRQRHGSNSAQMDFDDAFRGSHAAMGYRLRGGYDNDDLSTNDVKYYITTSKNGGGGGGGYNGMNGGGYAVGQGYMSASAERADDSYNSGSSRKRCNKKKGKKKKGGKKRSLEKQCDCGRKLNKRDSGSESDESETESFERLANDRNRHSSTTTTDGDDFAEFDGLMPVVMPPPPEGFQSPVINIVGPPSPSANSFIDVNRPPPPSDPLLSANDDDRLDTTVYIKRIVIGPGFSTNGVPGVRRPLPGFNPYDFVSSRPQPPPLPAVTGRYPPSPAPYYVSDTNPICLFPIVGGPPVFTGVPEPRPTDDAAGDDSEFVLSDASSSESSTALGDTTDDDGAQDLYARSVETGEMTAGDNRPETRSDRYETAPDVRLFDRQLPLPPPVVDRDFSLRPLRYPFPDLAGPRRHAIIVLPATQSNGCPYPVKERRYGASGIRPIYLATPTEPDENGRTRPPFEIKQLMTDDDFVARDSDAAAAAEPEATRPETGYEPAYGSDRNTLGDAETTGPTTVDGDGIHVLQPRSSWAPPVPLPYRNYGGNPAADWTKYLPGFMKGSQKERAAYSGTADAPNSRPAASHSHSDGIGSKYSKTTNTVKTTGGDNPVEVYVSQTQSTVPDDKSYSYSYSYSQ